MSLNPAYDNTEAQICMTLAALAYSSENDPSQIQAQLISNLANTKLATGGKWRLVWLGLTADNQNFVYVAKSNATPPQYAVALRGTDWCFLVNFVEDFDIFYQSQPGFGSSDVLVANGSLDGLNDITTVTAAPIAGGARVTLLQFLQNEYKAAGSNSFDVFVTGHSLGGSLASITFPWLVANKTGNWNIKAYTYAAPTAGNSSFASYVTGLSGTGPYYYWSVVNPHDIAPYGWGNLETIVLSDIPVGGTFKFTVEEFIPAISAVIIALDTAGVSYAQPGDSNKHVLTGTLSNVACQQPPVSSLSSYGCWVEAEHDHDNYLILLGAPPTNIAYTPKCPAAAPPAVEAGRVILDLIERWKRSHGL